MESLAARAAIALDNARRYERERRTALAIRGSLLPGTAHEAEGAASPTAAFPPDRATSSAVTGSTC